MSSKKPLSDKAKLKQSINEMLAGQGKPVDVSPLVAVRMQSGLSQSLFAKLLGVSVRTLQEWEQGRRKPSGAAQTLLTIARLHPEVLQELAAV